MACRIGEYDLAVEQLRRCVDRCPDNPALRLLLASTLWHADRGAHGPDAASPLPEALAECDRAVALDPDYARAYRIRAWVRQASGLAEGSKADLARLDVLMARSGPAPALYANFSLNFQPGPNGFRMPESLQSLARKILDNDPRDHGTRTNLAALFTQDDRQTEAITEFESVLKSDPGHLRARYQRALLLHRADPPEALAEYSALIANPRFEELFAEQPGAIRAYHHVATDLLKRGKLAEAMEVARRSLDQVNRSRALRNDVTLGRRMAGTHAGFSPAGETYYLIARIHAAEAAPDRDRVVDYLGRSFAADPALWDRLFMRDGRFDRLRDEICQRLGSTLIDR